MDTLLINSTLCTLSRELYELINIDTFAKKLAIQNICSVLSSIQHSKRGMFWYLIASQDDLLAHYNVLKKSCP